MFPKWLVYAGPANFEEDSGISYHGSHPIPSHMNARLKRCKQSRFEGPDQHHLLLMTCFKIIIKGWYSYGGSREVLSILLR